MLWSQYDFWDHLGPTILTMPLTAVKIKMTLKAVLSKRVYIFQYHAFCHVLKFPWLVWALVTDKALLWCLGVVLKLFTNLSTIVYFLVHFLPSVISACLYIMINPLDQETRPMDTTAGHVTAIVMLIAVFMMSLWTHSLMITQGM